jgi:XRE family transcriptional regulator, aerobic/anaerobic benzoate catabolism transcriptional regulator
MNPDSVAEEFIYTMTEVKPRTGLKAEAGGEVAIQNNETSVAESEFLASLGKRVRDAREARGLGRKTLAGEANVSERYLAQLEAGESNVSILLLRRLISALGLPFAKLLDSRSEDSVEQRLIRRFLEHLPAHRLEEVVFRLMRDFGYEEAARKKRVALVGLRGAGKSTLGRKLAEELRVPFVELTREIEQEGGVRLSDVFMLYGQSGFRRIERRCLERVIKGHDRVVVSVGGGIVSEPETYNLLLSNCYTVWLKAAPEEHMSRVVSQGDFRPMKGNEEAMEDLRQILIAREPHYSKADAIIDTSDQTPEQSLLKLRQAVMA